MKTFNLYCDENCHLKNDSHSYMLLSYTKVQANQKRVHADYVKLLKHTYKFNGEIKWSKISSSNYHFYAELIDYFFSSDMSFRAIVIEKAQIKNNVQHLHYDDFYYEMYYKLINHNLNVENRYNVYLDIKDTRGAEKVKTLKGVLQTRYGVIGNLQNVHSKESIFIQITDFIMGAVSYYLRGLNRVTAKNKIINKIIKESKQDLKKSTLNKNDKFNLFFIELGN